MAASTRVNPRPRFQVRSGLGQLLPLVEECIHEVDLSGRRVILNPGFID